MAALRRRRSPSKSPGFSELRLVLLALVGCLRLLPTSVAFQVNNDHISICRKATQLDMSSQQENENARRPWDILRFAQQSSRFVTLPSPFSGSTSKRIVKPGDVLWKPDSSSMSDNLFKTFAPLDDVVMGGASASQFNDATGKWTGTVTDANNGGFVGIRTTPNALLDMTACKGIELRLFSNKQQRLKVALRDSTSFNGIVWSTSVDMSNGKAIRVPFDKQVPTLFARIDNTADPFQKDNVTAMQLVYSKFEYDGALNPKFFAGPVDVQVEEIRAY